MIDAEVSRLKFARALAVVDGGAADLVAGSKWEVVGRTYPIFEVVWTHPRSGRRVGFRFFFEDWDAIAPSLELFDPASGTPLTWGQWPKNIWSVGNEHPLTKKPFLCLRGIREYHDHPSHLGDSWAALRGLDSYSMIYLVYRVQQRFEDSDG
jgi:hypothetical protein